MLYHKIEAKLAELKHLVNDLKLTFLPQIKEMRENEAPNQQTGINTQQQQTNRSSSISNANIKSPITQVINNEDIKQVLVVEETGKVIVFNCNGSDLTFRSELKVGRIKSVIPGSEDMIV